MNPIPTGNDRTLMARGVYAILQDREGGGGGVE